MSTMNWGDLLKEAGDSGSYDPLPNGDYDLVVIEATATQSQSGKTMFKIKSQVQGGPHDKRLVWDNLVISPGNQNALGIFFAKMASLGLNKEYFNQNPSNAQVEQALIGRQYRATIGTRTWQGEQRNEVKKYFPSQQTAGAMQAAAAPAPAPAPAAAPAPAPAPAPATAPVEAAASAAPAAPF